jgi:cytochrome c5
LPTAAALVLAVAAIAWAAQDAEFPDGEGKRILIASCTNCHDLRDVTKLRGYYNREQWRDVVTTMVEYGAEMKKGEDEVLVEYLTRYMGKRD